jgi:NitT/TauT family transport system permease protein
MTELEQSWNVKASPAPSESVVPVSRSVGRARKIRSSTWLFVQRVAVLAVVIALWQLTVSQKWLDRTVTSSPHDVFSYLWTSVTHRMMWNNLWDTVEAALIAFLLASVVGVVVGIALALMPRIEKVVDPYLSALNAMPRIALAPVFIVAFGLTMQAKVALAFTIGLFIMITSARAGVRSVDNEHLRLATVLGAKQRQLFTKILFPVAVPSIFGGLRLAVIYCLLGTLTAELIGSNNGMGQLIQQSAGLFRIDQVYTYIIILAITAALANALMGRLERYLLRWQAPTR